MIPKEPSLYVSKPKNMSNTTDLKSFHYLENGEVSFSMFDTIKSNKTLDSGCYQVTYLDHPENRVQVKMDRDLESVKIYGFPDKEKLDNLFNSFFSLKVHKKVRSLGFYHKVGVLLYGKEGTGKSTIIKYYFNKAIVENKALVFYINRTDESIQQCWEFIMNVRKIQNNPIIVVLEEFDEQMKYNEGYLKKVLDGNLSIDNCIFMATTNYIHNIPEAMKDRVSRFKYSLDIEGVQSKEEAYFIIKGMLEGICKEDEMEKFSEEMKNKTLDQIKQFCLDKIMDIRSYNSNRRKQIGFKAA